MSNIGSKSSATAALRSLQSAVAAVNRTQSRLSTGLKVEGAKDNASYWAISTGLRSDEKSLSTVKDSLGLGAATVATAYQGLSKTLDLLDGIKAKLTAATQADGNRGALQSEIAELQQQLRAVAASSSMSGQNWLAVDSSSGSYASTRDFVASVGRDASGSLAISTMTVDASKLALFDRAQANGGGVLGGGRTLVGSDGKALTIGGTPDIQGNRSDAGLSVAAGVALNPLTAQNGMNTDAVTGIQSTVLASQAGVDPIANKASINANVSDFPPGVYGTAIYITIDGVRYSSGMGSVYLNNAQDLALHLNSYATSNSLPFIARASGNGNEIIFTSTSQNSGSDSSIRGPSFIELRGYRDRGRFRVPHSWWYYNDSVAYGSVTPATSAALTCSLTPASLSNGDVITVSYRLGPSGAVQTHDITVADASTFDKTAFAAAWGSVPDVTVAAGSGSDVTFTHSGVTGSASQFTLTDVVVRSSAATGSVIKNIDPLGGITGSKAASVKTGVLTWPGGLAANDRVSVKLAGVANPFTVEAGASLDDFVAHLNTAFAGAYSASRTVAGELVLTAGTTGAGSSVAVESIAFTDAAGAAKVVTTTGLGLVTQPPSLTGGAFSAFTLDANDTLSFTVQSGAGAARAVSIDQALVNATLGAQAQGAVGSAADYKRVVDAALAKAGVTGVSTSLGSTPATADKLSFIGQMGQPLTIGAVAASQGGPIMSVDRLDVSDTALAALGVTSEADRDKVLAAYLGVVSAAIAGVTSSAAYLGAVAKRIDTQKSFVDDLMDNIDKGVGALVDADMDAESTRLQALQVKQELGLQALSIINRSARNVLQLFQ